MDVIALMVLAVALVFVLTTVIRSPLKDDVAWLLWVAKKWLAGRELYVDLVEVNPPLVIWLYAIPAGLALQLNVAPKFASTLFFAVIILGSAWWTSSLLHCRARLLDRRVPLFSLISTLLLVLPGVEYGQREHLLTAVVLPYIALLVRALEGEREPLGQALVSGAIAALGCAMKPSYGLALVLLELIAFLRGHRRLRVAPLAFLATTGVYGLAVLTFEPDFLTKAVPLALALYEGTDVPVWHILDQSRNLLFGLVVAVALCWRSEVTLGRHSSFLRHLYLALVAFALACTVLFVLQGKDWFYHRLPATTPTVLALILWLSVVLRCQFGELGRRLAWRKVAVPVALGAVALVAFGIANVQRVRPWVVQAA